MIDIPKIKEDLLKTKEELKQLREYPMIDVMELITINKMLYEVAIKAIDKTLEELTS